MNRNGLVIVHLVGAAVYDNTLLEDGAMNTVDWNISLAAEKRSSSPSGMCNSTG